MNVCIANVEKTDQSDLAIKRGEKRKEECRLKWFHLFHRLKNIFAIASDICFQRAIQFLISARLVGLSFITVSQWSTVILHGVKWFLSILNVFLLHPLRTVISFNFYMQ